MSWWWLQNFLIRRGQDTGALMRPSTALQYAHLQLPKEPEI